MLRLCLILCLFVPAVPAFAQAQVSGWHSDLDSARKVAHETGKPLFVVFRCVR